MAPNTNRLADPETVGAVAGLMRLLGDPTRIRVLGLLHGGEMNVSALCGKLDLAQPTVSHHLGLLRTAGLVCTRRDGKQIHYSLNPEHLTPGEDGNGLRLQYGLVRLRVACDRDLTANGQADAGANGHANGQSNGHARGLSNGSSHGNAAERHGNGAHTGAAALN